MLEPKRISLLPDLLISQIAAGEVVERPANIVKELIENALDAGSSRIEVSVANGGMEEIRILDNGGGIAEEDLGVAIQRHTTSKIQELSDLESIETFGFRGEALSSIASVAEVELTSRTHSANAGKCIKVSFGRIVKGPDSVAAQPGTSITVRELFSQVPARQKFLRSGTTEFSHCSRIFRDIALGNPHVAFVLYHEGKRVRSYAETDMASRVKDVLQLPWEPLHFSERTDEFQMECFLSPSTLIQDRGEVFIYVNHRPIKSRFLASAIRNAYLEVLGPHHEPSGVVFFDIRKDWVDVNVHPQKTEVRCLKQERLYQWCLSVLRKRISQAKAIRVVPAYEAPTPPPLSVAEKAPVIEEVFDGVEIRRAPKTPIAPIAKQERFEETTHTNLKYLGQLKASYLVCEDAEGVLLIDQHALHEKIRYEELLTGKLPNKSQPLLIPRIVHLSAHELQLLKESHADFERAGIEFEFYGDNDIAIKSRPELLEESTVEHVIRDALKLLGASDSIEGAEKSLKEVLNMVYATVACHSVVRANQTLSPSHAQSLIQGLDAIELGWTCPHGRPVLFRLPFDSILKHFRRT